MKRAWSFACLLAAWCGLTMAMGLAEPLAAAPPEGVGAENAPCPYLRMRQGCYRGDAASVPTRLDAIGEAPAYCPASLLGPQWDVESAVEPAVDHEWDVYRRWLEGRWYHDSASLPEELPIEEYLPVIEQVGAAIRHALEFVAGLEQVPAAPSVKLAASAIAAESAAPLTLAARISRAALSAARLPGPAIAEPHDIYASQYRDGEGGWDGFGNGFPEEESFPSDLPWEAGNADDFGPRSDRFGYDPFDSEDSRIEPGLGDLDRGLWGRVREFGSEELLDDDNPWEAPLNDSEMMPSEPSEAGDEPLDAVDGIPYEAPEGFDFSSDRMLSRFSIRVAQLVARGPWSLEEVVAGVSPLLPARLFGPERAPVAPEYAAQYRPTLQELDAAPSRIWGQGLLQAEKSAESVIPNRESDHSLPAHPESGRLWDASPVESALQFEVRPMTRRAIEGAGEAIGRRSRSEDSALRRLPDPRRLLSGPAKVLEQFGTALQDLSAQLTLAADGNSRPLPGAQRNSAAWR